MRKLKFRVWDNKKKNMIYDGVVITNTTVTIKFGTDGSGRWICNGNPDYIPMQYTGLRDINNKEICEGDIISVPYIDPMGKPHIEIENYSDIVEYKNGEYILRRKGTSLQKFYKKESIILVIGNQFDNPELLGEINE